MALMVQTSSQTRTSTLTSRQLLSQGEPLRLESQKSRLLTALVAAVRAFVMPVRSGPRAAAAAFCWSRVGLSGVAATVLSVEEIFISSVVPFCESYLSRCGKFPATRLTDRGGVSLDGVSQGVDVGSLSLELTLSQDGVGNDTGGQGNEGEEDGLHVGEVLGYLERRD
jgi:hypothetical protein